VSSSAHLLVKPRTLPFPNADLLNPLCSLLNSHSKSSHPAISSQLLATTCCFEVQRQCLWRLHCRSVERIFRSEPLSAWVGAISFMVISQTQMPLVFRTTCIQDFPFVKNKYYTFLVGVCVNPVTKRYFYRSWFCILSSQVQTWSTEGIVACVCLLSLLKLLEMVMVPESLDAYSKLGTWEFHVDFLLFERNVYVLMHEGLVFVVIDALEMLCNFIR
jgi:hypothetical protein